MTSMGMGQGFCDDINKAIELKNKTVKGRNQNFLNLRGFIYERLLTKLANKIWCANGKQRQP